MKLTTLIRRALCPLVFAFTITVSPAQGPLTPPGVPAPTQKSLQEIWNKVAGLETQLGLAQSDLTQLRSENHILSAVLAGSNVQFAWTLTTVAATPNVGSYNCIAFAPDGQPAISYFDAAGQKLKFARFNGAAWSTAVVDAAGSVGSHTSMTFGPDGQPAISYFDSSSANLKFARFNGAAWVVTTVDATGTVGEYTSLAFGPDGQPAISYSDATVGRLKIARFNGSIWTPSVVETGGVGPHSSLAFGPDGQPAISYWFLSGALKVARFNGAVWVIAAAQSAYAGQFTSLAFGPDGQPSVSHRGWSNDLSLYFSRFDGFTWASSELDYFDAFAGSGGPTSLAFGPNGQPAISFHDPIYTGLKYASFNGTTWTVATLATSTGAYNSLSFGPDGQPAISFHDSSGLKIARRGIFKPVP